jgi:uncharacterized membrane protein YbhN (UPF0104 family)
MKRPSIRQIVQVVFTIAVVVFIAIYLIRIDWSSLDRLTLEPVPLIVACVIALLYRYWGAGIWLLLLQRLGADLPRPLWPELAYVYAKAWLGRYILGAGTWILGKVYFASQHGIGRAALAISGLLEGALQLLATLVVGLAFLVVDPRLAQFGGSVTLIAIIALVLCVIAILPPVFRFLMKLAVRVLRRGPLADSDLPGWRTIGSGAGLYLLGTLISGASYFFIARAVYEGLGWEHFLYIVGTSSVAAAISLLAVFAPGGIGVREGVQVAFFAAVMPVETAVVVSVIMRLWSLAIDALFFGTAVAWRGAAGRRGNLDR